MVTTTVVTRTSQVRGSIVLAVPDAASFSRDTDVRLALEDAVVKAAGNPQARAIVDRVSPSRRLQAANSGSQRVNVMFRIMMPTIAQAEGVANSFANMPHSVLKRDIDASLASRGKNVALQVVGIQASASNEAPASTTTDDGDESGGTSIGILVLCAVGGVCTCGGAVCLAFFLFSRWSQSQKAVRQVTAEERRDYFSQVAEEEANKAAQVKAERRLSQTNIPNPDKLRKSSNVAESGSGQGTLPPPRKSIDTSRSNSTSATNVSGGTASTRAPSQRSISTEGSQRSQSGPPTQRAPRDQAQSRLPSNIQQQRQSVLQQREQRPPLADKQAARRSPTESGRATPSLNAGALQVLQDSQRVAASRSSSSPAANRSSRKFYPDQ